MNTTNRQLTYRIMGHYLDYLKALQRPPNDRLRGLALLTVHQRQQERRHEAQQDMLRAKVVLDAKRLRLLIEAGRQDIDRIKRQFADEGADREALLAEARRVVEAVGLAEKMLRELAG